jgi:AcrR family transcriptional regulator
MTEKAEQILNTALQLFVENGFDGTSTIQIAKQANVSEALIFRHFTNKAGLLEAIVKKGQELMSKPIQDILGEKDPETIISRTLELPLVYFEDKSRYWKLLIDFKSKDKKVSELIHQESIFEKLQSHVKNAFKRLGYKDPENEMNSIYITIYGISALIYNENHYKLCQGTIDFLKSKYKKGK